MLRVIVILIFLFSNNIIFGQNTVGVLKFDNDKISPGYNLIMPNKQSTTFLLNTCGEIVHLWEDNDEARVGAEVYLLEDGSLIKAKGDNSITTAASIGAGGTGGIIERVSWENELIWRYIIQDSLQRQHHDIHVMPNGNVLAIVHDRYYFEDIVAKGFDTLANSFDELWPDKIVEIDPLNDSIVWEWKAWDHLIQDQNPLLPNYKSIKNNPQSININYHEYTFGRKDFLHSNAIDYYPELDQIMLSVKNFNEIWIIDHSTTSAEAATNSGGNSGKGGGLLWRWGNPEAYNRGDKSDRVLFSQHDCSWIDLPNSPYQNMISVYNNFINGDYSLSAIINPSLDADGLNYVINSDSTYLPNQFHLQVSHPDTSKQFSSSGSNFQLLSNGNYLLHAAIQGRTIELDPDQNPVWEYIVPLKNGLSVPQGQQLDIADNFTFSSRRYSIDHPAFIGRDLSPKGYLELEPNSKGCTLVNIENKIEESISIYPNPVENILTIESPIFGEIKIFDLTGTEIKNKTITKGINRLNISNLPQGLYFGRLLSSNYAFKFVKK